MHRMKIKLSTTDDVNEFVRICSTYDCDINLYDGRKAFDAKSLVGVLSIQQGKILEVQAITHDEDKIVRFLNDMKKYEV